jgi:hypothetical protein
MESRETKCEIYVARLEKLGEKSTLWGVHARVSNALCNTVQWDQKMYTSILKPQNILIDLLHVSANHVTIFMEVKYKGRTHQRVQNEITKISEAIHRLKMTIIRTDVQY